VKVPSAPTAHTHSRLVLRIVSMRWAVSDAEARSRRCSRPRCQAACRAAGISITAKRAGINPGPSRLTHDSCPNRSGIRMETANADSRQMMDNSHQPAGDVRESQADIDRTHDLLSTGRLARLPSVSEVVPVIISDKILPSSRKGHQR
jgi:hypothetical protein